MKQFLLFTLLPLRLLSQNPASPFPGFYFDNCLYRWNLSKTSTFSSVTQHSESVSVSGIWTNKTDEFYAAGLNWATTSKGKVAGMQMGIVRLHGAQKRIGFGIGGSLNRTFINIEDGEKGNIWFSDLGYFSQFRASERLWLSAGYVHQWLGTRGNEPTSWTEFGLIWFISPKWKSEFSLKMKGTFAAVSFRCRYQFSENQSVEILGGATSIGDFSALSIGAGFGRRFRQMTLRINYLHQTQESTTHQLKLLATGISFPKPAFFH